MYYHSKYDDHNKSLEKFAALFNKFSRDKTGRFEIRINKNENFIDDGKIYDKKTNKEIIFDWEKRQSRYISYGFPYDTFGQFERKIKKQKIKLSIQCSKNEDCFCIAWHSDFEKEDAKSISSITEKGEYEHTGKRFTKHFLEIKYSEMEVFYKVLEKAFDENKFNKESFVYDNQNNYNKIRSQYTFKDEDMEPQ